SSRSLDQNPGSLRRVDDKENSAHYATRVASALGRGLRPRRLTSFLIDLETTPRRRIADTAHACWTPDVLADQPLENSASGAILRCEGGKRTANTLDHERAATRAYWWNSTETFKQLARRIDPLLHGPSCVQVQF